MQNTILALCLLLSLGSNLLLHAQAIVDTSMVSKEDTTGWTELKRDKYQISYPHHWQLEESGEMGSSFILFSPLSDATDVFKENVNLLIQDLAGFGLDLDKFVEITEGQIAKVVPEGKILYNERLEKDGQDYQRIIYSGKQGLYGLKFLQHFWVIHDKAYILTLTCELDQYEKYREVGERIIESFELRLFE